MDKLLKVLKEQGYEVPADKLDELRDNIRAMDFDPDNLTTPQIHKIVSQLVSVIAKSGSSEVGAPTQGKSRGRQKADASGGLKKLVEESADEVRRGLIVPAQNVAGQISSAAAEEVLHILRGIPADAIAKVGELAQEAKGDTEFFRIDFEEQLEQSGFSVSGFGFDSQAM